MSTARDWFADEHEFRQLCGDAQSQARGESSQEFAAEMVIKANEHGLDTFLSPFCDERECITCGHWRECHAPQQPKTVKADSDAV